jgi:SAM-dependent methyltransferase
MFKEVFVEHLESLLPSKGARILELGSGRSTAVVDLLERRPDISYTGIEPYKKDYEYARDTIGSLPNVRLINELAYDIGGESSFDLCFSLSVLEHVKQLERFLSEGVKAVKSGGHIVHRYDLGHSLHPSSLKERFQVFLGNRMPQVLPEHKFVRHLDPDLVVALLKKQGADTQRISYHQMPQHKTLFKHLAATPENFALERELSEWEFNISPSLSTVPKSLREKLFPAIAVWAKKR